MRRSGCTATFRSRRSTTITPTPTRRWPRRTRPISLLATVEHAGGPLGQWLYDDSIHGPGLRRFTLFGSEGQIDLPGVRSGRPLQVFRDDHDGVLPDAAVLALVPDFALDERTARLFGGERLARYAAAEFRPRRRRRPEAAGARARRAAGRRSTAGPRLK